MAELLEALNNKNSNSSYLDIMESVDLPATELEPYLFWRSDRYTRNCINHTDDYELLAICYENGQSTPIHDFDFQEAWIHPVMGKLQEERFRLHHADKSPQRVSSVTMDTRDFAYMDEITIHRYKNIADGRTVTLNLYVKPIEKWRVYEAGRAVQAVNVSYDSVYGGNFKN